MLYYRSLLAAVVILTLAGTSRSADKPRADLADRPAATLPPPTPEEGPLLPGASPAWPCPECCCTCCESPGRWIGGVGFYVVQPFFTSNPAYMVAHELQTERRTQTIDRVDLSHDVGVAPLLWLGYVAKNGLGGRARWWYFRQGTEQLLSFEPSGLGSNLVVISAVPLGLQAFSNTDNNQRTAFAVTSNLLVQVGDIEAVDNVQLGKWDMLFSGGVRLAHVNQHYNVYSGDAAGDNAIWRSIQSGHSFNGAGPVLAVEAHRPLGCTPFGFYGSARAALLFGSAKQSATFIASALRNDDANPSEATDHRNRVLPVAELELGMEYVQNIGNSSLFGQIALVGQDWFGGGNASRSTNHAFPGGFPVGGAAVDSDFGFLGVSIKLGLNF